MANIDHLYNDPDWMLQAGLGDKEFEQDMYDDIVYGEPADSNKHTTWAKRQELLDSMDMQDDWAPLADYDELGLMGLRKHASQGPLRYLYTDAEKEGQRGRKSGYLGQTTYWDKGVDKPNRIDLNLEQMLYGSMGPPETRQGKWDPNQGSLQDYISDVYRHEYKHPLFSRYLYTLPEGVKSTPELQYNLKKKYNQFRDHFNVADPQHAPIRATGALYGKSSQMNVDDFRVMDQGGTGGNQVAGRLVEHARRQYPHLNTPPGSVPPRSERPPSPHFSTGGLASLML